MLTIYFALALSVLAGTNLLLLKRTRNLRKQYLGHRADIRLLSDGVQTALKYGIEMHTELEGHGEEQARLAKDLRQIDEVLANHLFDGQPAIFDFFGPPTMKQPTPDDVEAMRGQLTLVPTPEARVEQAWSAVREQGSTPAKRDSVLKGDES